MAPYDARITYVELDPDGYRQMVDSPLAGESFAGRDAIDLIVVRGASADQLTPPGALPVVVAWIGDRLGGAGPANADLVVGESEAAALIDTVSRYPLAAVTLALHLRAVAALPVAEGLVVESATYSMLQAGPEFAAWRQAHTAKTDAVDEPAVLAARDGDELIISLNRPHRHNAINVALRDGLADALAVALADDTIAHVQLRGNGASFCSGGDLHEFGRGIDPATSHRVRLARSPAWLIHRLGNVTTHLHGAAMGGGIELAAFSRRIVAARDTRIALPEIGLGLIPGAGGTVSITRRAGRQRTAALALTGASIDAETARGWGLVDAIA